MEYAQFLAKILSDFVIFTIFEKSLIAHDILHQFDQTFFCLFCYNQEMVLGLNPAFISC